jgi:hypothetical protein
MPVTPEEWDQVIVVVRERIRPFAEIVPLMRNDLIRLLTYYIDAERLEDLAVALGLIALDIQNGYNNKMAIFNTLFNVFSIPKAMELFSSLLFCNFIVLDENGKVTITPLGEVSAGWILKPIQALEEKESSGSKSSPNKGNKPK